MPTAQKIITCAIPPELETALAVLQQRHGTPVSEAIRRGLRLYLEREGVLRPSKRQVPKSPR